MPDIFGNARFMPKNWHSQGHRVYHELMSFLSLYKKTCPLVLRSSEAASRRMNGKKLFRAEHFCNGLSSVQERMAVTRFE